MITDMTNVKVGIPNKVRGVAAELGYTQERVAKTIGISRTQLAERYAGRTSFKAEELLTLSVVMGVPIERFYPSAADASPTPASSDVTSAPSGGAAFARRTA